MWGLEVLAMMKGGGDAEAKVLSYPLPSLYLNDRP